jgi:ApaG protein
MTRQELHAGNPDPRTAHAPGSITSTRGIRIEVEPAFVPEKSDPVERQYHFAYHIRICNESSETVQLLSRHWVIVDSLGRGHEVKGDGVVGKRPRIEPGRVFEYSSYCSLKTPWGTMEGGFRLRPESGEEFDAAIGRFYLIAEPHTPGTRR